MQKIDRSALVKAQLSGGCCKNNSATANASSPVIIYVTK
jgi:hypothetical protein